jgi:hypothetical protein
MAKKGSKKRKISQQKARSITRKEPARSKIMTDPPKPWPYHAAADRDESAEDAQDILQEAADASEKTNDPDVLRALNRITRKASNIVRRMEKQGAKTRPIKE